MKQFALSELGILVLPAFAVVGELKAGQLKAIPFEHLILQNAEAHLVTRVGRTLSVASNKMLQMISSQTSAFR